MVKPVMTQKYLVRKAEDRKIRLIQNFIKPTKTILDFGCGNGLYGQALKSKCKKLIAMDLNPHLLEDCLRANTYDEAICEKSPPINQKTNSINVFFASEVIEHMPELSPIMAEVERVTSTQIVLTMPNPLYPYFYDDPTHILKYTVKSLSQDLNTSHKFNYKIKGLGFENIPTPNFIKRLNQFFLWYLPWISPTIAIIGERKK